MFITGHCNYSSRDTAVTRPRPQQHANALMLRMIFLQFPPVCSLPGFHTPQATRTCDKTRRNELIHSLLAWQPSFRRSSRL